MQERQADKQRNVSLQQGAALTTLTYGLTDRRTDLFPKQGTTTALDDVEVRVDLVGAVNSQVQLGLLVKRGQGDPAA
jgi:hypothetical protein